MSTWEQPPAQNPVKSAFFLTERTAILQPIGSSDKRKQSVLASREYSNTQTPIPLNITSNIPSINQIMAYQDITKLEKFSEEENNAYLWIVKAKKAITTNNWDDDRAIQSTEQEANYTQAVNLAINGTSNIDAKITQLSEKLTQKIEEFLAGTTETYQLSQWRKNNNNNRYSQQQIPTTTELKPISATKILAKHSIPISHLLKSTTPVYTTSPVHLTTTPELLPTTTNNTSNPSLSNSLL
ncbi:hypothetical protein G9A89_016159 [Geosiphon pyriformis]|nr:hypothetical protein G9A89_016159 [Geosiphon pyriformis]